MKKTITKKDLNDDQTAALDYIHKFIEGPNRQMILTGPAGTGKTALLNVVLSELGNNKNYPIVCTAPTNKAVSVISRATKKNYNKTVCGLLGLVLIDYGNGKPYLKQQGESTIHQYSLVVIDESSMLDESMIMQIQSALQAHPKTKVIYVGDACQLPPVSDEMRGLTQSRVFELPLRVNLTKVMRVADANPILDVVTTIRQNMASPTDLFMHETHLTEDGRGIEFVTNQDEFYEKAFAAFDTDEYKSDSSYAAILAYTNAMVKEANTKVREHIYGKDADGYVKGEELRVAKPYIMENANGKGSHVVYNTEDRIKIETITAMNDPSYGLPCFKVRVHATESSSRTQSSITAYILSPDPTAESMYMALLEEKRKEALDKEKECRFGGKFYSKKEAWADYMKLKNFFLWAGYVYSQTIHTAQGSTITNVFCIESDINRLRENHLQRNKLKYTAFTRAAERLTVLT